MLLRCGFSSACSEYHIWTARLIRSFRNGKGKTITSEDYTREETTIFWTLDMSKGKTKLLMEGKIEGTRLSGKQRRTWTSDMLNWCGLSYMKCVRRAENRKEWRSMAADLLIRRWYTQWQ